MFEKFEKVEKVEKVEKKYTIGLILDLKKKNSF